VSTLIPTMTRVAWESNKAELAKKGMVLPGKVSADSATELARKPALTTTRDKFLYNLSRSEYVKEWGDQYQKPGILDRILSFLFHIMPKVGPFKRLTIKPSTPETELLFMRAFDATTTAYRRSLVQLGTNTLDLDDRDLDTGKPTRAGEYALADDAYARLLHSVAKTGYRDVTPALRANIVAFFRDTTMRAGTKKDSVAWVRTLQDLSGLRAAPTTAPPTGGASLSTSPPA
jgi:hypothetical protein